jgi:hypothetical protein
MERDEIFPITTAAVSAHLSLRGYDCRPAMLGVLLKNGVVKLARPDVWSWYAMDPAAKYFEQSKMIVPYTVP